MPSSRSFIKVNKFGNWNGLISAFKAMDLDVATAARAGQTAAAKKLVKIVKDHILHQDLALVPLSERTIKRKGHSDIYLDSRLYFESINYWWENKVVKAGVKRGLHYPNGNEISNVAALHEFGGKKMIRRPIWNPSIEELNANNGIRNIIADTIVRKLQRTFAGTPAQITRQWVLSYYE